MENYELELSYVLDNPFKMFLKKSYFLDGRGSNIWSICLSYGTQHMAGFLQRLTCWIFSGL